VVSAAEGAGATRVPSPKSAIDFLLLLQKLKVCAAALWFLQKHCNCSLRKNRRGPSTLAQPTESAAAAAAPP
jgi:hypothetical protein